MSEEKVLTLRGKRAVWAPVPAGVGSISFFIVKIITTYDGDTYEANMNYEELFALLARSAQVVGFVFKANAHSCYLIPSFSTGIGGGKDYIKFNADTSKELYMFSDNTITDEKPEDDEYIPV